MENKLLNPVYIWISENVQTEKEIAKEKSDLYCYALSLSCDFLYSEQQVKKELRWLAKAIAKEGYKPKHAVAMAICLYLESKYNARLDRSFVSNSTKVLKNIHEMEIPLGVKSAAYYFQHKYDSRGNEKLRQYLIGKQKELTNQHNLTSLAEVEFALSGEVFSEKLWKDSENEIVSFEIDKKSKIALLLKQNNIPGWEKYLDQIERKCQKKISEASIPIISLLVYEAEKLISTNLPTDKLNELLEALKKKKKSWASLISQIQENGVTLNLTRLNQISGLNIEEACWALQLLNESGRKVILQMSELDKKDLAEYRQLKSSKPSFIPMPAVKNYLIFALLWLLLGFIYFEAIGKNQLICIFINECKLSYVRIVPEQLGDFISLPVAVLIFLKYYYHSWQYLVTQRHFDFRAALRSLVAIKPIA